MVWFRDRPRREKGVMRSAVRAAVWAAGEAGGGGRHVWPSSGTASRRRQNENENIWPTTSTSTFATRCSVQQRGDVALNSTSRFWDLIRFVESKQSLCVLTGAGISTESGIPDYRGPQGAYTTGFKPVMHLDFVRKESVRKRYWGRSMEGWRKFSRCRPNSGHIALANMESTGRVNGIITQNVDRLHQQAGSKVGEGPPHFTKSHSIGLWVCDRILTPLVGFAAPFPSPPLRDLASARSRAPRHDARGRVPRVFLQDATRCVPGGFGGTEPAHSGCGRVREAAVLHCPG